MNQGIGFSEVHLHSSLVEKYLDDDLSDSERSGVEAHARQCPECEQYLAVRTDIHNSVQRDGGRVQ